MLESLTPREERMLEEHLAHIRSPARKALSIAKTAIHTLVGAYLINAGVQFCLLARAPGYEERLGMLREGTAIAERLARDDKFLALASGYIRLKQHFNDDFDLHVRHFEFYKDRAKGTEAEFSSRLRRVYDPRAILSK